MPEPQVHGLFGGSQVGQDSRNECMQLHVDITRLLFSEREGGYRFLTVSESSR
jgi:hypothetical protein